MEGISAKLGELKIEASWGIKGGLHERVFH
jgi:hypothetical protein